MDQLTLETTQNHSRIDNFVLSHNSFSRKSAIIHVSFFPLFFRHGICTSESSWKYLIEVTTVVRCVNNRLRDVKKIVHQLRPAVGAMTTKKVNGTEGGGLSSNSVPARNCYRVTGELSRGDELPNAFLDRFRWLELLQKNILQGG